MRYLLLPMLNCSHCCLCYFYSAKIHIERTSFKKKYFLKVNINKQFINKE